MLRDTLFYNKKGRMNNKKFLEKIENFFIVHVNNDTVELETWTDYGVNMIIPLDKKENLAVQFIQHVHFYDWEEEVDFYRSIKKYRENFTLMQSVDDFQKYDNFLINCVANLKGLSI